MQQYAEDAVTEHLKELQGYFFKEKKGAKKAPYTFRLTQEQVDEILGRAMRLSDRYRIIPQESFRPCRRLYGLYFRTRKKQFRHRGLY